MSEERVTYTELKFPYSKKQENKWHPAHKRREFPWHIVATVLGIMCLFLLLAIAGLGYMFFQYSFGCKMEYGNYTKENNITSSELEDDSVFTPTTERGCGPCRGNWSCCGSTCYYFSEKQATWHESDKLCQEEGSRLIKIEDKMEQNFIEPQLKYGHWVGLYKKGGNHEWTWQDGSKLSRKLNFQQIPMADAKCGYIKPGNVKSAACTKHFYYICEKNFACLANSKNY